MGLTPDQFTVIRTPLEAEPDGLTQKALADAMSSDPNTIASLLERMEANEFVQRRPHEKDRRANRVDLLAGQREYEAIRDEAIELQGHVLEQLPEGDREKFLEQLEIVAQFAATFQIRSAEWLSDAAANPVVRDVNRVAAGITR